MIQTRGPRNDERRSTEMALESGLEMNVVSRVQALCINLDKASTDPKLLSLAGQKKGLSST